MTPREIRLAAGALAALALFAVLFSVGHALGAWPRAAPGGFAGIDLVAGFVLGAIVLVFLLRREM